MKNRTDKIRLLKELSTGKTNIEALLPKETYWIDIDDDKPGHFIIYQCLVNIPPEPIKTDEAGKAAFINNLEKRNESRNESIGFHHCICEVKGNPINEPIKD